MKAEKLLYNVLKYWPSEIDISDSKVISETNGFKSYNLSQDWSIAEQRAKNNEWDELAVWVIYGLLHEIAKENFSKGVYKIYPTQITVTNFKLNLLEALQNDSYESMLLEYKQNNK